MVARIKRGSSLSRTLNYNEQKVKLGGAECINAVGYPKDLDQLSFYDKLHRLEHQAALNERITANTVHISLNFADADQLDQEKLNTIADTYMRMIGFGKQPYLVYEHKDAGHQHIHIVTTNIRADGSKIEMNNIGRNQSEKARKTIEVLYGLTKAEQEKQTKSQEQKPDHFGPPRVQYGKNGTKQAISNVLEYVTREYKFTSLGELNAILQLYNVAADPGKRIPGSASTRDYYTGSWMRTATRSAPRSRQAPSGTNLPWRIWKRNMRRTKSYGYSIKSTSK